MSRIEKKFIELKKKERKAFIAFLTAGDPDIATTFSLALELEKRGTDILELGVPFSDPLADGLTIQASSQRALKNSISLKDVLKLVAELRERMEIPICILTYYNPIHRFKLSHFVREANKAGLDGVIIPDLPPEEGGELKEAARKVGLETIFFLSPTSSKERMRLVARETGSFIYYTSLTGVTGAREELAKGIEASIKTIRRYTTKPIAVGFGISTPEQIKQVVSFADGAIVGSAIIDVIEKNLGRPDLVAKVGDFVAKLVQAVG